MRVSIKHGVHETNGTLALVNTLLVDLRNKKHSS
jgi:hypothetical protein